MWRHIQVKKNREVLTLLVLITATVVGGGWTAYTYFGGQNKLPPAQTTITATGGSVAAQTITGNITTHSAPTPPK